MVVTGGTAVGKTRLCVEIAKRFGIPIVNADSRQVFADIPIGTAAPTVEEQSEVKHFFVGTKSLEEYYSASLYEQEVLQLLPTLFASTPYNLALMTGGSMMYIDAVCKGIDDIPTVDDVTRELMKRRLAQEGLPALVEELRRLDYTHWQRVDRKNPRRVVHALEICHMTGRPFSSFLTHEEKPRPFRIIKIGLQRERSELYERINQRVYTMISQGLEAEALRVYPYRHCNALNTVGYKEMFDYLDGLSTLEYTIERIQSNTRAYMRKQITWFKRDKEMQWFHPDNTQQIIKYIESQV